MTGIINKLHNFKASYIKAIAILMLHPLHRLHYSRIIII